MTQLLSSSDLLLLLRNFIVVAGLWVWLTSVRERRYWLAGFFVWPLLYYLDLTIMRIFPNVVGTEGTFFKVMATFGWVGVLGWVYYAQLTLTRLHKERVCTL